MQGHLATIARVWAQNASFRRRCDGSKLASIVSERRARRVSANADFSFGDLQARAAMLTPGPMTDAQKQRATQASRDRALSERVDATLEDSFPASDPPSWTTSVVRPRLAMLDVARVDRSDVVRRAWRRAAALF
jgi:hypothetical protein